jgi:glutamine---fructose-6-phosphate transaminase (isomerizing)
MCGIVGYVGHRPAQQTLLEGLRQLEYRGYDSAGISIIVGDEIESVRAVGNLANLDAALAAAAPGGGVVLATRPATTGIGHTRWATHGQVNEDNAHPHFDTDGRVHVVVNGIVENYMALKQRLVGGGSVFTSETDAEVIAHLVAQHYQGDLARAVRRAYAELEGHYAFVAMMLAEPQVLVGARKECPLVVGRGDGEQFIASAVPAFLTKTRRVQYLENGDIAVLHPDLVEITTALDEPVERPIEKIEWDVETAEKGGYETFMLKEIEEQADAVAETIFDRTVRRSGVDLGDLGGLDDAVLSEARRIVIVACGTSYHAGLIGRYAIESWARIPVEIDIASEYRYRNPVVGSGDLVIAISQSGETADTLAALHLARERGAAVLGITNVMGSQIARDSHGVLFTRAGMEVCVASTKTFVCQVALMYLLGVRLAELRATLSSARIAELVVELKRLPHQIDELLKGLTDLIEMVADGCWQAEFFLYLGRHIGLPVALEGALKLKEISYISTDAYAAGEMKHGPIALLDENTPVVCVATDSPVLEKVVSNIQEVRARGARVIAVTTEGNKTVGAHADAVFAVPYTDWMLQPILAIIPLQLLAYTIARRRGLNIDQPRNLAKTVTVE